MPIEQCCQTADCLSTVLWHENNPDTTTQSTNSQLFMSNNMHLDQWYLVI